MKKLIRQGFYCEMPHAENTDPSILGYIEKAQYGSDKSKILQYLRSGTVIVYCCGTCNDVIHPENGIAGVPSFYTDGRWVWPGDLHYYVDKYDLLLPVEFTEDMKNNNWEKQRGIGDIEEYEIV